jgi:DDE family transposase
MRRIAPTAHFVGRQVAKKRGGRKRCLDSIAGLQENFESVLRDHTAGDPMHEEVQWTHLTLTEIAGHLVQHGTPVSVTVVRQLLKRRGSVKRKAQKRQALGQDPNRDPQFQNIARLRAEYQGSPNPIVSLDTKKKELIGNFSRDGKLYTLKTLRTWDHDFPSVAEGVIIPHGLYDVKRNHGHINLGVSHDTRPFACDSIYRWWQRQGPIHYPLATSVLLLCDGGGSNASNRYVFKAALQELANRMGLELRIAHYPPYESKSNPIEHRLFPHVTRACQGVVFVSVDLVKDLMERTTTKTGLRVTVDVIATSYPTGAKAPVDFKKRMAIVFDDLLPKWNYRALPQRREA